MRKHFLILMLMALLPLAGFAAPVSDTALPADLQVTFTALTYDGTEQTPTIASASSATATTLTSSMVEVGKVFADQAGTNEITVKNAGKYYVQVKGNGTDYSPTSTMIFELNVAKFGDIKVSANPLYKVYGAEYPTTGFFTAVMPTSAPDDIAESGLVVTPSFSTWELTKEAGVHQFTISVNTVTNYNVVVEENAANLTINKVNLTVKAKDVTKSYGVNPRSEFDVTYGPTLVEGDESTFGDLAYVIKHGTTVVTDELPAVGTYTITPSLAEHANYNFNFETGTLTVNERSFEDEDLDFSVVFDNLTYNGGPRKVIPVVKDNGLNKTLSNGVTAVADDYTLTYHTSADNANNNVVADDADLVNVGTYYVKITGQGNYTGAIVKPYKVNQKSLWITSKSKSSTYNATAIADYREDLATYALFEGLVATDAETSGVPKSTTYATSASIKINMKKDGTTYDYSADTKKPINAGEYDIVFVPSTTDNTALFTNYKVVFIETGKYTIEKAEVKVTIRTDLSKNNGETSVLEGNGFAPTDANKDQYISDITGLVTGHAFTTYPTLKLGTQNADESYPVVADFTNAVIKAGSTTIDKKNYDLKYDEGLFTINKGQMAVRPVNITATYGEEEKELFALAYGGATEDNVAVQNLLKNAVVIAKKGLPFMDDGTTINTAATDEQKVDYPAAGQYTLTFDLTKVDADALAAWKEKYTFEFFDESTYTINKAPIKIKLGKQSLQVGDSKTDLVANEKTVTFEGLVNNDKAEALRPVTLFDFTGAAVTANLETGNLKPSAATYQVDENPKGYFAEAITLAATTVYANYTWTAADVTKGDLWVNITGAGSELVLDEQEVTDALAGTKSATDRLTAANNYKFDDVKVTIYREQTIGSKTYSWKAQQFNALVLPFDVTVTELAQQFDYAIVNVVNPEKTTEGNIYWSLAWGTIAANTPFVIRTVDDVDATAGKQLTFADKTIDYVVAPSVEAGEDYKVVGAYAPVVIDETSAAKKRFFGDNTDHGIKSGSTATWTVVPFDAYLDYTGNTSGREVTLTFEDLNGGTTSISSVELARQAVSAEGWYTLNGVKLQGVPAEKGVYIQNGKKVVIK